MKSKYVSLHTYSANYKQVKGGDIVPRAKKGKRKDGRVQIKRVIGHDYLGKAIYKWFYGKTKREALEKYHDYLIQKEQQEIEKKNMPFEKWTDTWLYTYKEPDVRPTTFGTTYYRPTTIHILPYFEGRILQDITQADIKAFGNKIMNLSQSMIDKIMLCLYGIFETALDNDLIMKNPVRNVKIKSNKEKQNKRTYDKATTDYLCSVEHKYALMLHILLRMGLRASELCGLEWKNIDLINRQILICQCITTENGVKYLDKPKSANSTRKLPIPDDLLARLEKEPKTGSFLFEGMTHKIVGQKITTLYNYLKVPKDKQLTPHELRHTCGTLLYQATKDIYHVSRFLGHSDTAITTKIYVHSEFQQEEIHIDF